MGAVTGGTDADLDRRRQIYKNVRKEIEKDDQMRRQDTYQKKMTQLEEKVQLTDKARKVKAAEDQEAA